MIYPLNISFKRLVGTGGCSRTELLGRLDVWARRYAFEHVAADEGELQYRRGNAWQSLASFDIRTLPTIVRIQLLQDEAGTCVCTMSCKSWLHLTTPGDAKRVSDELDLLAACLDGSSSD